MPRKQADRCAAGDDRLACLRESLVRKSCPWDYRPAGGAIRLDARMSLFDDPRYLVAMRMRFKKISRIDEERLDDELILLHPVTLEVKILNDTATVLWEALETFPTADELVELVAEARPEIPVAEVRGMVTGFLDELVKAELVERLGLPH